MASEGYDRRRERLSYTGIKEETAEETESEFVEVPIELKGHVIGRGGCMLQEIMRQSGARISSQSKEEKGFLVNGDKEQRAYAKKLILEKVEGVKFTLWELVKIPGKYKGLVMGTDGAKLREISAQTGAKVIRSYKDGEVYIKLGNHDQRKNARALIGNAVSAGKMRGIERDSNKVSRYIDGFNLPGNKVKLKQVQNQEAGTTVGSHSQFRLKPAQVYETQESSISQSYSYLDYKRLLMKDVLMTLKKINHSLGAEKPKADMWCHFGRFNIRVHREEKVEGREWTIDEVIGKFQSTSVGQFWKLAFIEGVELTERIFKGKYKERSVEDVPYFARYDMTIITPCFHQVRCKVWVSNYKVKSGLESVPSDLKNRLEEIYFEDEATRLRCKGWLVLKSVKHLQADIMFPGCEFDCRFTIRARTDNALTTDPAPEEEVRKVLLQYLSGLTLSQDDAFGMCLPAKELPEGFSVIHRRWSRRTEYTSDQGFLIILSKELTWNLGGDTRESTDVHLHCEEWDLALSRGVPWEPEAIVRKLPEFLEFVMEVQGHVFYEMNMVELRKTTPPEILARGPSALEAYKKALEGGKTSVKRVPIMLIGQDRAGKTSLKKSLKGICFDPNEDSTVGIEVDPSYFSVSTETWKTGEKTQDEDLDTMISFDYHMALTMTEQIVASLKETGKNTEIATNAEESQDSIDIETNDVPREHHYAEQPTSSEHIQTSENTAPTPRQNISHVSHPTEKKNEDLNFPSSAVPEEVATVAESFLRGDLNDGREDIYSTFWDFAGQSVYYVTHPLFLTRRAIYCLVYDLSLNPEGIAKPVVKQGVYKEVLENCGLKTNLDYLDFWMMSVASLTSCESDASPQSDHLPETLPPVFLVCTHADTPYDGRNPKKVAHEIFGFLKNKPYGGHLHDVFVVDNTSLKVNNSECPEIVRLRQEVLAVAKILPHIDEVIPVKWLKFEKVLKLAKEKGYKCITLETARVLGRNACNIVDDGQFNTLMDYLHDLRSIIHFKDTEELNKMVVLNPRWLIDVFKKVITIKPHDARENNYLKLWCKLERDGILDEKLLEHVWGRLFNKKETCDSLIEIMNKFCLLCPWPSDPLNGKSYLVPSMLKLPPPAKMSQLIASAKFPSLFIKFENGQVPLGFFPRLVIQFFQWGKEKLWKPGNPHLFRNFARFFTIRDDYSVILICHSSTVEIVVHGGNCSLGSAESVSSQLSQSEDLHPEDTAGLTCCRAVSEQLGLMLECMRNEFFWLRSMKYEMTVTCTVCCKRGAVEYCQAHNIQYCKEEQCLHFLTLAELFRSKKDLVCSRSAFANNSSIQVMQFAPWFPSEEQYVHGEPDERLVWNDEGNEEKSVALPEDVLKSLISRSCDSKEVVFQFKEALQLDESALKKPDVQTKRKIRCLARQAKCSDRSDVIKQLRDITPAGTTGPLMKDSLDVRKIPHSVARKLTIALCGGDEWKLVAERLGLDQEKIRFLDNRTLNPADALIGYMANQRHLTVADLYKVLCDCELPVIADTL